MFVLKVTLVAFVADLLATGLRAVDRSAGEMFAALAAFLVALCVTILWASGVEQEG